MKTKWRAALVLGTMLCAGAASAHELVCEETFQFTGTDGGATRLLEINECPATITGTLTITNTAPYAVSVVEEVIAPFLYKQGLDIDLPLALDVGESFTTTVTFTIDSQEECLCLAKDDCDWNPLQISSPVEVKWDLGSTECNAALICNCEETPPPPEDGGQPPPPPDAGTDGGQPPPPPPDAGTDAGTGATRTIGYYMTHPAALTACLDAAGGSIDLGYLTVDTTAEALGILWASPAKYENSTVHRSEWDQKAIITAKQLLGAICNSELFGTTTPLIAQAQAALEGTNCTLISSLGSQLDTFNNSGDNVAFPNGGFGSAQPQLAQALADEPAGTHTNNVCGGAP